MFNSINTKEHYKMYKKGKAWIFAGIVTASLALGVVGGQTAHADTLTQSSGEQDQAAASGKSAAPDKQVVLGSSKTADKVGDPQSDAVDSDINKPADDKAGDPAPVDKPADDTGKSGTGDSADKGTVVTNDDSSEVVNNLSRKAPAAPTARMAAPTAKADESIDAWMPNKILQADVLSMFQGDYLYNNPAIAASGKTWSTATDITQDDMLLLNYLYFNDTYIDGKSSFSLKGLEYATNLTDLVISDQLNYAPYMIRGDVTDITPLQGLTKLTSLEVLGQRVTDITPISGLKDITSLSIAQNCIADFSSLNAAQYSDLRLDDQFIENKVIYIPKSNEYALVSPIKAPQGLTFTLDDIAPANGLPITAPLHPESTVRVFWNGATGYSLDGDKISFTGIKDQIMPGQTENPWAQLYPNLVAEDYTYFLNAVYTTKINGINVKVAQMVTPYIKADQAADVTVNYVDDSGNQVADPDTLTGFIGEGYTAVAKAIDGYELTKTPDNATGAFSDTAQTVTFVYKKVGGTVTPPVVTPSQTVTMTVHYETSNGTKVAPDVTLTGKAGDSYTSSPATVDGYKLLTAPANANGTFGNTDGSITYVYAKTGGDGDLVTDGNGGDKPSTNKPGKPATKPDGGKTPTTSNGGQAAMVTSNLKAKPGTTHTANLANPANAAKATLPQTNDETISPLWGLAVLGSLLGLVGWRKRTHK